MSEYYIYLRKSRADRELEALGQGETLARHEKALLDLAGRMQLPIAKIYKEIVSGETIDSRPEVKKLLEDINNPDCAGVLVMEIERLARGNTKDQGIIAEAFQYSNTKIITPAKTYDPNDEFDEEYFEFGLFMSRREYKTINRRIQRGRIASASEGKFIGSTAPYGYEKVKIPNSKGYTLNIIESEAKTVRYIYELYVNGTETENGKVRLGRYRIAKKLDELGIKPRNADSWSVCSIRDILTNPVYAGKIRWGYKKETRQLTDGRISKSRSCNDSYILVDGLHHAIVTPELFEAAQNTLTKSNSHTVSNKVLKNPLAGLVKCKLCGSVMTRIKSHKDVYSLTCPNRYCKNISSPITAIESSVLTFMENWLAEYKMNLEKNHPVRSHASELDALTESAKSMEKEIDKLRTQLNKTYDLLEQGIYTNEIFLSRSQSLTAAITENESRLDAVRKEYKALQHQLRSRTDFIPNVESLISLYCTLPDAQSKNQLLKTVIDHIEYKKDVPARRNQAASTPFQISVFPKISDLQQSNDYLQDR